jgi:glycosyltransferase involved in cell wall biosynthesis
MVPIILQTFDRISYSMQVISAIKNHILYPHTLIVIDNASTDGTVDYLKFAKQHGLIDKLILNTENKGIAEPKNQGLEIVKELAKTQEIKYVCISDNDIVPPFIRDGGCALEHIVKLMDANKIIGMCGVDLNRQNAPANQDWWWRLRQHPSNMPTFAEISIGFWFAVIRYEFFNEFKFNGASLYGRVDESCRNYLTLVKQKKVGLLKGCYDQTKKETVPYLGTHLGWREDLEKFPEYVTFKKRERYKAEILWKENNRKW